MSTVTGDALANSLDSFGDSGGANPDLIQGLAGNDTLISYVGNDTLDGGDDDDLLLAGDGADWLIGGAGNDELRGDWWNIPPATSGNDFLDGGAGNDTLYGGAGADTFSGGAGNDYIWGDSPLEGVAGNDSIDGGDGDDYLDGEDGNDTLLGGLGADELFGSGGSDWLEGGDDDDYLEGESANDTLFGGLGADELRGNSGDDWLAGDDGSDVLYGDLGGSAGNDTLDGGAGVDMLRGEGGNDTYLINDLNDDIFDSGGTDTAIVSVSDFKVPDGIENVQYINGAQPLAYYIDAMYSGLRWGEFGQPVTLNYGFLSEATAGATANSSTGFGAMSEADKVVVREALANWAAVGGMIFVEDANPITNTGASGVDLRFGLNSQPFSAGYAYYPTGGDIYIDFGSSQSLPTIAHEIGHALGLKHPFEDGTTLPLVEDSDQYTLMSYTSRSDTIYFDFEGPELTIDDYLFLDAETPQLYDVAAMQYLYGVNVGTNAGNTVHAFSAGAPFFRTLWDAGGIDVIDISNFSIGGVIDLRAGHFSSIPVVSDAIPEGYTATEPTYFGIDNLAIAYGAVIENAIGGSGNDTLFGNDAGNWLDGGAGADTLDGGAGNDTYVIDDAGDSVTEAAAAGLDTVRSGLTHTLAANVETLMLTGGGHVNGAGNAAGNILSGNAGNNTLDGAGGADIIAGGPGNDTYVVDHSGDQVMELGNSGNDSVQSAVAYDLMQAWHVENLTLTGGSAVNGSGNWLDNLLTGNGAANALSGNRGNDTLASGGGVDTLTGGSGADAFYFDAAGAPDADLILDFQSGSDHLGLSLAVFSALGASGAVSAGRVQLGLFSQINATSGDDGNGQDNLKYASDTGQLYYDSDGAGGTAHSLIATIYSGGVLAFAPVDDVVMV